jgi:hypothetical protein
MLERFDPADLAGRHRECDYPAKEGPAEDEIQDGRSMLTYGVRGVSGFYASAGLPRLARSSGLIFDMK